MKNLKKNKQPISKGYKSISHWELHTLGICVTETKKKRRESNPKVFKLKFYVKIA